MRLAGLLLFTYLAGSINFAIIVLRLLGKEDPRTKFSGNAGTTNVYRQAGWGWAAVVLLLDVGRAAALAALALALLPFAFVPWIGLALVAGNRFPLLPRVPGRQRGGQLPGVRRPDRALGGGRWRASSGSSSTGSCGSPLSPPSS